MITRSMSRVCWVAAVSACVLGAASIASHWGGAGIHLPWQGTQYLCVYASGGRLWIALEECLFSPPQFEAWGPGGNYIVHDWDLFPHFALLSIPLWIPAALAVVVTVLGLLDLRTEKGRCLECGHILAGSATCPECGYKARAN